MSARIVLENWNLDAAERLLCLEALKTAGNIIEAARLLGITRHALKRRIIKHNIEWPPPAQTGGRKDPRAAGRAGKS